LSLLDPSTAPRAGIGSGSSFFEALFPAFDMEALRPFKLIELDLALGFLSSSGDLGAPIGGDLRVETNSGERE